MVKSARTHAYDINVVFEKRVYTEDGASLPYRIYIPKNYDCGEMYPMLIFLHGAGERGTDNELQFKNSVQDLFSDPNSPVYDSIVIVPQCPTDSQWVLAPWANGNYSIADTPESRQLELVCRIMDEVFDYCNVDEDRVYVTGLSMGGFGTWDLLSRHGARFAAGMPVCGGGDTAYAKLLKRIPIRTFHGSDDPVVPVTGTRKMYASIKNEGGENIDYTEFDGCGHNVWDLVYKNPENIEWLYAQSREDRRKKAEKAALIKKAAAGGAGGVLAVLLLILGVKKKKKNK